MLEAIPTWFYWVTYLLLCYLVVGPLLTRWIFGPTDRKGGMDFYLMSPISVPGILVIVVVVSLYGLGHLLVKFTVGPLFERTLGRFMFGGDSALVENRKPVPLPDNLEESSDER